MRQRWVIVMAMAMLVAALVVMPDRRAQAAASGPRWGATYFPNVELTTQDGQQVHFYDDLLKGKIVVIDLIYTRCVDSCPLETARLVQVQRMLGERMGKDIFFYSISIDPKHDTPQVLKAYAEKYHVGPGWLFLTGKPADIDLISKKLGLYSDPDPSNRDGHTPGLMVGNEPQGQWMRNAATDNPRFLAHTIGNMIGVAAIPQASTGKSYAQATAFDHLDKGQYLFQTRCAACHTIGHGVRIGPDLLGITNSRDRAWLTRFIQKPDVMLEEQDPIATALFAQYKQIQMPNLRLGPEDVESVVKFLETQNGSASNQPTTAADAPATTHSEKSPQ
jgi:protein SCO1/2